MADLIDRKATYYILTEYYHHKTQMQHAALIDALGKVPTVSTEERWIPCSERLPESDCCVRVATESGLVLQTCFSKSENRFVGISRTVKVTCWMPLPTLLEVSCDA